MGKKKVNPVLCDSNVLFKFLEGDEATRKNLDKLGLERTAFSVITAAEAYAGCNKVNFQLLKKVFGGHVVYHITEDVSKRFNGLFKLTTIAIANGFLMHLLQLQLYPTT